MKILVTARNFTPLLGGSINYTLMFARQFVESGAEIVVWTRTPDPGGVAGDEILPFPVIREGGWRNLWRATQAADVVMQVEPSIQDAWPALLLGVPVFPTLHVGAKISRGGIKERLIRRLQVGFLKMCHPVGVSRYVADSWGGRSSILNPYDDSVFFSDDRVRSRDCIFVGRFVEDKGVLCLLDALQILAQKRQCPEVALVGDGPLNGQIDHLIAKRDLVGKVTVLGRLPANEVAEEMRNSCVLVFPTLSTWLEASPLTILEGLACGCQVIASNVGGVAETGGGFVTLVEPDSPVLLAEALLECLKGQENFTTCNVGDLRAFLKARHLESVVNDYLNLFSEKINKDV